MRRSARSSIARGRRTLISKSKCETIFAPGGAAPAPAAAIKPAARPAVPTEDEAGTYGYIGENRHMVECFRHGKTPIETFVDGVEVTRMVMGLYKSAETGQTVRFPDESLETYVNEISVSHQIVENAFRQWVVGRRE